MPKLKDFMASIEAQAKEMAAGKNRQSMGIASIPVAGGFVQITVEFVKFIADVDRCPECQGLLGKTHYGVRDCEECGARFDAEDM